jgi:Holliday junction resolvasome RuvABC endonuclease subunit
MKYFAGFDCCSKSIACVIFDSNKNIVDSFFIESTKKIWEDRLTELVTELDKVKVTINIAYIETPIYMQNIKATNSIARVVGIVHSWLIRNNIPDFEVDVKAWKKGVLGNGNAKKEEIMKFVKSNYGSKLIYNQDLADAACISLWGVIRG